MRTLILILINLYVAALGLRAQNCKDLLMAVKNNQYEKVQSMLKTVNPNCSYDGRDQPRSPLGMAALNGNLEIGKLLFKHNAKASHRFCNMLSKIEGLVIAVNVGI